MTKPAAPAGSPATSPAETAGSPATSAAENAEAAGYPGVGRVLVVIPTYNEIDNLEIIVGHTRAAVPEAEILVADDNSPDGTGRLADEIAARDEHVHVLHRAGKQGLGAAYVAGFGWARENGYDAVVEMDADGSHAPEELPKLLNQLRTADMVLGSRWVKGGTVLNWPKHRLALSRGGNLYARLALGMPIKDATGGYRAYRREVLEKIDVEAVASQGYCFQVDLAWRAYRQGFRLVEVPITFAERERGQSKMSSSVVREALWRVTVWGTDSRLGALRKAVGMSRR
ncbi:MAG TPA: polyprenol monophosphomannose synthase [Micromonosporaceae bacterium]|jgi:dolichol-phosphate mannosyltransferase